MCKEFYILILFWCMGILVSSFSKNYKLFLFRVVVYTIGYAIYYVMVFVVISAVLYDITFTKEIAPDVYLNSNGLACNIVIPKDNIPIVYEFGDPQKSGYALRWWRWIKIEYIFNMYDYKIARQEFIFYRFKKTIYTLYGIVDLPYEPEIVTIYVHTDNWLLKSRIGSEKSDNEFEVLVWPPDYTQGRARIEKLVFK